MPGRREMQDGKMACHACGRYFKSVAMHLRWAHDMTVDEYKERYGLSSAGLVGSEFRARLAARAKREGSLEPYYDLQPTAKAAMRGARHKGSMEFKLKISDCSSGQVASTVTLARQRAWRAAHPAALRARGLLGWARQTNEQRVTRIAKMVEGQRAWNAARTHCKRGHLFEGVMGSRGGHVQCKKCRAIRRRRYIS